MAPAKRNTLEVHAVINDLHVPYHDQDVIDSFLSWCREHKPDVIHINGDFIDFPQISKYDKDPDRLLELQDDLDQAVELLEQIRSCNPKAKIYFHEGNHEARLHKYKWKNPELSNLRAFTIRSLLELDRFAEKYYSYDQPFVWRKTFSFAQSAGMEKFDFKVTFITNWFVF